MMTLILVTHITSAIFSNITIPTVTFLFSQHPFKPSFQSLLLNGEGNISLSLPENKRNFILANLSAIDEDSGDEHVFTVDKGPPGVFTISGHQLKVCSNTIFKSLVI